MGNKSPISVGSTPSTLPNDIPGGAGVILPQNGQVFHKWGGKAPFCPSQTAPYCKNEGSVYKGASTGKFDWKGNGAPCWMGTKACCCYNYVSSNGPSPKEKEQCKAKCQVDIDNQSTVPLYNILLLGVTALLFSIECMLCFCIGVIVCFCIGRKRVARNRVNNNLLKSNGILHEECEVHALLQ